MNKEQRIIIKTERAAHDLRKGFPVIIESGKEKALVFASETCLIEVVRELEKDLNAKARLILSANRKNNILRGEDKAGDCAVNFDDNIADNLLEISGVVETSPTTIINEGLIEEADNIDKAALKLTKIAELIPSAITIKIKSTYKNEDFLTVDINFIDKYQNVISETLEEVCRAPIALSHAENSEIIAFRPNVGGKEHYAIIIGKPSDKPLVRLHSSCYTGDLLASLECDCRDQLHSAIEIMGEGEGGIILYMLQEGRGIGLINKLRAYSLKAKGKDTVDANEILGFYSDERTFLPAAQILKKLGINEVSLLTNNPRKIRGLEALGIKVVKTVPHIMETNSHNEKYIKTKASRLGHAMKAD